ncbi:MAG: SufE family protein [Chlamydiia bacterium]|nr:SufE family protein [Chlamydiia bacterium]
MEFQSCLEKQRHFLEVFSSFSSQEEKYHYLIDLGRKTPSMPSEERLEEFLVQGCQSLLYLKVSCSEGRLLIITHSDALISAGIAFLIAHVYHGEPPEAVFKCPPRFIQDIGLLTLLSPSRANGLKSLYQKLQKEAMQWLK